MLLNTKDQFHACFRVLFVSFGFCKNEGKKHFSAFQTNEGRAQVPMRIEIMKGEWETEWEKVWSWLSAHLQPFFSAHSAYFSILFSMGQGLPQLDRDSTFQVRIIPNICQFFLHEQNFWGIKFTLKKRVNYDKIQSKLPNFRIKSVKVYTGQKKFTRIYSWGSWQIWGMVRMGGKGHN